MSLGYKTGEHLLLIVVRTGFEPVIVSISTLVKADTPLFEVHGRTYSNVSVRVPTRHLTIKKPHYKTIKVQLLRSRCSFYCSPYGNRTRDSAVKGQRLNPLPNGPLTVGPAPHSELVLRSFKRFFELPIGLEPTSSG